MNDALIDEKLATFNLNKKSFQFILNESTSELKERLFNYPLWLKELENIYSENKDSNEFSDLTKKDPKYKSLECGGLLAPIISKAIQKLISGVEQLKRQYSFLPFDINNIEAFFTPSLFLKLSILTNKTITLELNIARLQDQLIGETPEERYDYFINSLADFEIALPILKEYSVLTRRAINQANNWVLSSLELLNRLCVDWNNLCGIYNNGNSLGLVRSIELGAGDSHRGGRSVAVLEFEFGNKIVYKPRSLAIDTHFQNLLAWLNEKGNHVPFKTLNIINCDSYGWVEFVERHGCGTEDEIKRFYSRQGGYLAILYILKAVDFHHENLIADGEHPVLIDLEALFHSRIKDDRAKNNFSMFDSLTYSVARIGLLPKKIWGGGANKTKGIDISGLGGAAGQISPYKMPVLKNIRTDEMHFKYEHLEIASGSNRAFIKNEAVNPLFYTEQVIKGFTYIYNLFECNREELLVENGPLDLFANDEIRYIARATRTYATLLQDSNHPDLLRSGLNRDKCFDLLWFGIDKQPWLKKLIKVETEDLHNDDIPIFITRPNSTDLYSSNHECISNCLEISGLDLAKNHISNLCQDDLEKQIWLIKASFASLTSEFDGETWGAYNYSSPKNVVGNKVLTDSAKKVGDRLISLCDKRDGVVSWLGISFLGEQSWDITPVGLQLYSGLPGIIFFLAYLGFKTGEAKYTNIADLALTTLKKEIDVFKERTTNIGAFEGWGGIIYLYSHLGKIWNNDEILLEANVCAESLDNLINADDHLDIIGGAAGAILGLNALYNVTPSDKILNTIIKCGDHIISRAQKMKVGKAWKTGVSNTPLAGISHGVAGISYALLKVYSLTKESRFRELALESLEYERSLFSQKNKNWKDVRDYGSSVNEDSSENFMVAWCHGAPGIGMGRIASLPYVDDDTKILQDIEAAIETTLVCGVGHNHSLCHGDLGNVELFLQAQQKLRSKKIETELNRLTSIIVESFEDHGWLCGVPLSVEIPGLMTGLAGIGYQLLRLSDPSHLPSILVLDPPK